MESWPTKSTKELNLECLMYCKWVASHQANGGAKHCLHCSPQLLWWNRIQAAADSVRRSNEKMTKDHPPSKDKKKAGRNAGVLIVFRWHFYPYLLYTRCFPSSVQRVRCHRRARAAPLRESQAEEMWSVERTGMLGIFYAWIGALYVPSVCWRGCSTPSSSGSLRRPLVGGAFRLFPPAFPPGLSTFAFGPRSALMIVSVGQNGKLNISTRTECKQSHFWCLLGSIMPMLKVNEPARGAFLGSFLFFVALNMQREPLFGLLIRP